jgi:5-formyltetrahydrofolate cyclo-ligase
VSTPAQPPEPSTKSALRDQVLAARRQRPLAESVAAAEAIAEHVLAWDAVRRGATVAAYVSVGREPGTGLLLDALRAAGKRVLLPVLRADNDLDWAVFTGELVGATRGLLEPAGPLLGVAAITGADVVLVPGLAASIDGERLGRGGGSYDRALARVGVGVPIGVLLHEDEAGRDVPIEPHDRRVTHVVTPAGVGLASTKPGISP